MKTKTCALPDCDRTIWTGGTFCSVTCSNRSRRKPREHGTYRGAQQHRKLGDPICDPCLIAETEYRRSLRRTVDETLRIKARGRARHLLTKIHAAEYQRLFWQELVVLQAEADSHADSRSSFRNEARAS